MDVLAYANGYTDEDVRCQSPLPLCEETWPEIQHAVMLVHRQGCQSSARVHDVARGGQDVPIR